MKKILIGLIGLLSGLISYSYGTVPEDYTKSYLLTGAYTCNGSNMYEVTDLNIDWTQEFTLSFWIYGTGIDQNPPHRVSLFNENGVSRNFGLYLQSDMGIYDELWYYGSNFSEWGQGSGGNLLISGPKLITILNVPAGEEFEIYVNGNYVDAFQYYSDYTNMGFKQFCAGYGVTHLGDQLYNFVGQIKNILFYDYNITSVGVAGIYASGWNYSGPTPPTPPTTGSNFSLSGIVDNIISNSIDVSNDIFSGNMGLLISFSLAMLIVLYSIYLIKKSKDKSKIS